MIQRYTRLDNGDIVFPRKGPPPTLLSTYTRDPQDPYLFHPNFPTCAFRITITEPFPCCPDKFRTDWKCKALQEQRISVVQCRACELPKEAPEVIPLQVKRPATWTPETQPPIPADWSLDTLKSPAEE